MEDRERAAGGGFVSQPLLPQNAGPAYGEWTEQRIPANLGIVGTVNMDESSHGFSRKVLDRAFTLELSEVDLSIAEPSPSLTGQPTSPPWPIHFWHCPATRWAEVDPSSRTSYSSAERATALLQQINECLVRSQLQVGYRTRDEVILFLINALDVSNAFRTRDGSPVDPLDVAIMMKVLPRLVGGSSAIRATICGLLGLCSRGQAFHSEDDAEGLLDEWGMAGRPDALPDAKLPRTAARLCLMWERLMSEGYTSYWL